jgi:hypothetical protein
MRQKEKGKRQKWSRYFRLPDAFDDFAFQEQTGASSLSASRSNIRLVLFADSMLREYLKADWRNSNLPRVAPMKLFNAAVPLNSLLVAPTIKPSLK